MILYVDSSVLLRVVLGDRSQLREWRRSTRWVSSDLLRVECLRILDRMRLQASASDEALAEKRALLQDYLRRFDWIDLDATILERAAEPFPTPLGTLDALHLATAIAARRRLPSLALATHDRVLAIAARSSGLEVLGVADLK